MSYFTFSRFIVAEPCGPVSALIDFRTADLINVAELEWIESFNIFTNKGFAYGYVVTLWLTKK